MQIQVLAASVVLLWSTLLFSASLADLPTQFQNLQVTEKTAYTTKVEWDADYSNELCGGYSWWGGGCQVITRLYTTPENELLQEEVMNGDPQEFTFVDLAPNTTYLFAVVIRNLEGEGNTSSLAFSTDIYGPPTKIRNFRFASLTTSSVSFIWDAPLYDGNSPVTNYSIFCSVLNSNNVDFHFEDIIEERHITVNGLLPGGSYSCNGFAVNEFGLGAGITDGFPAFMFTALQGYVDKVENVTVDTITTTSAHLSWSVPLSTFPIGTYVISFYDTTTVSYKQMFTESAEITLSGLESDREYVARVHAADMYYASSFSLSFPLTGIYTTGSSSDPIRFTTPHYVCAE